MMRVIWLETRRSPLRWWLPLFVVLNLAILFGRSTSWIGVWPQASAAAQLGGYALTAMAGAAGSWCAGREHRSGTNGMLSASWRSRWQADFAQFSSTVLYVGVPYLIGAGAAAIVSAGEAGPGFLWPGYLLLGAGTLLLSTAAGHLAGKYLVGKFAPTVAIAVLILVFGMFGSRRLELFVLSGMPQEEVLAPALTARIILALAVAAAAVLLPGRLSGGASWNRLRRLSKVTITVAAVAGCIVVAGAAGPLRATRPAPAVPLCNAQKPRVCMWPDHRKYLPEIAAMAGRLTKLPSGLFKVPDTFYERGVQPNAAPSSGFLLINEVFSVPDALAGDVMENTFRACDFPDERADDYYEQNFSMKQWLAVHAYGAKFPNYIQGGPEDIDMAEIYRVTRQPDAQQAAWVRARVAALKAIDPGCA